MMKRGALVFGATVEHKPGIDFLSTAIGALEPLVTTVGIYRASPPITELQKYIAKLNKGKKVHYPDLSVNMLSGLVKAYFRSLEPEPVIPFRLYESFIAAVQEEHCEILISNLLDELPYSNFILLETLMAHLYYVSSKSDANKMPPENLAIVWGQNLLKPKVETPATILGDVMSVNTFASHLIASYPFFFSANKLVERRQAWEEQQATPEPPHQKHVQLPKEAELPTASPLNNKKAPIGKSLSSRGYIKALNLVI
eukprot:TRINITY_DN7767_c0_g1_i2.p1 TRINITY_DN7767_c0_g1~~TRINITY_DN7767_c0_g1_i2.p1  ORF type:complete len:255 (+),score=40.48 TRINITY_DN7767_c0_g1_i2:191-955(+)